MSPGSPSASSLMSSIARQCQGVKIDDNGSLVEFDELQEELEEPSNVEMSRDQKRSPSDTDYHSLLGIFLFSFTHYLLLRWPQ